MPDATPIAAPPKRRWYQYGLRTLFIVITLIGVALGLYVGPKVRRHNVVLAIEAAGGKMLYADPSADESWLTKLLRNHVPRDWCDEIKEVSLAATEANDATLAGFETLPGLQGLWLGGTQVTDAGLDHLKGFTGLRHLSLEWTQVTDASLPRLKDLTCLHFLSLYETQVTRTGVADLQKSLPDCSISR